MIGGKVPFVIGVAGGTSSGKSTVCARIIERLEVAHKRRVVSISQDSFYRNLTVEESERAARGEFNFDHPDAIDHNFMLGVLKDLMNGETVQIPIYDFCTNSRTENFTTVEPADIIFVEGILIFYYHGLRGLFDMKLFIDADSDDRLARRIRRDLRERGRTLTQVLNQYLSSVKPAFEEFCLPTKKYADVIIPHGAENEIAIDLILHHINEILRSPSSSLSSISDGGGRGSVEAAVSCSRLH